jgi:hypothetical protein
VGLYIGIAVVIALLIALGMFVSRSGQRQETGVENFRRHIDALSPEARREVQDRVRGNNIRRGDFRDVDARAGDPDDEQEPR